jgi:hypothetical protein
MVNLNKYQSPTVDSSTTILGTLESLNYSAWQSCQAGAVAQCYQSGTASIVELHPTVNSCSGCTNKLFDACQNTTSFSEDRLYPDLKRYSVISGTSESFSQTLSGYNLYGNQITVAYAAFEFSQLGHKFCIVVSYKESGLITLCQENGWSHQIVC